jgi:hypothetical protein
MTGNEELRQAVRELADDGKATCRSLLDLAARTGADPTQVGRICDELRIHISECQLGCFR